MTELEWTGTKVDQLLGCPTCNRINTIQVALSTTTPGVRLAGVVHAFVPCEGCDRVGCTLLEFGDNDA
jgi:hypothetical protein